MDDMKFRKILLFGPILQPVYARQKSNILWSEPIAEPTMLLHCPTHWNNASAKICRNLVVLALS